MIEEIDRQTFRRRQLENFGASPAEVDELLAYNDNVFGSVALEDVSLPLGDEPFVAAWEEYARQAEGLGVFAVLQERLVQFRFPIQKRISGSADHAAATRRGQPPTELPLATGLALQEPNSLGLVLWRTPAGRIPVLSTPCRADFVSIVQALAYRNEPHEIPPSMGATIISGLNNWDRVHAYRRHWENSQPGKGDDAAWKDEFQRLSAHKDLYQDRLIVLSGGPYSGVPAAQMHLEEAEWGRLSLELRRIHEATHYLTRRVFGSVRNNLLDEILADYAALVATLGHFRADWLLMFLGLEDFPRYREGGRLQNYLGRPPLSAGAVDILQVLRTERPMSSRLSRHWRAKTIRVPTHSTSFWPSPG